ncbi:branched-chain amino acid ABC transporter permease [Acrocarpospora catenulata]|uniref:branched-chain amino acid ABC transporter permease n=1 Tax=Acrocarpospora catenulata TaxID=2836182 RepID=UPI001BD91ABA|nr:branched-chain amino acid ABC transporter permease [Acrocarpospora catenulata]
MTYLLAVLLTICIWTVVAQGLVLVFGHGGVFSVAQVACMGVGGYTTALLASVYESPGLGFLMAPVVAAAVGAVIGLAAVAGAGESALLVTFAAQFVFEDVVTNLRGLTGGANGISAIPPLTVSGVALLDPPELLALTVPVLAVVALGLWALTASPWGRRLRALRDNRHAAPAYGIPRTAPLVQAFAVSAGVAGIGGALYVATAGFVSPHSFGLDQLVMVLTIVVLGGQTRLAGAAVGAVIVILLQRLPAYVSFGGSVDQHLPQFLFGLLLVLAMLLLPNGLLRERASVRIKPRSDRTERRPQLTTWLRSTLRRAR